MSICRGEMQKRNTSPGRDQKRPLRRMLAGTFVSQPLLRAERLVKHFKAVRAVDDISFELYTGETLALVGESGCGKSTAGRLLLRLIEPTSGKVWFDERDLFGLAEREVRLLRREMQIIFQDPYGSLNPRMTVREDRKSTRLNSSHVAISYAVFCLKKKKKKKEIK